MTVRSRVPLLDQVSQAACARALALRQAVSAARAEVTPSGPADGYGTAPSAAGAAVGALSGAAATIEAVAALDAGIARESAVVPEGTDGRSAAIARGNVLTALDILGNGLSQSRWSPTVAALQLVDTALSLAPRIERDPLVAKILEGHSLHELAGALRARAITQVQDAVRTGGMRAGLFTKQEISTFGTFLGVFRFAVAEDFRATLDLLSPINRLSAGEQEVLYRGDLFMRKALETHLLSDALPNAASGSWSMSLADTKAIALKEADGGLQINRMTSDVANVNVYFRDETSGQFQVMTMVLAGKQPRPCVAAGALSDMNPISDSTGESVEDPNQHMGKLIAENLIPELGVRVAGSPEIDAAKGDLLAKIRDKFAAFLDQNAIVDRDYLQEALDNPRMRDNALARIRRHVADQKPLLKEWTSKLQLNYREHDLLRGGFGFTEEQFERVAEAIDRRIRDSGGVVSLSPLNPSCSYVGNLWLSDILGIINEVLGLSDGGARVDQGAIERDSISEVSELGREIRFLSIDHHLQISRDLRAVLNSLRFAFSQGITFEGSPIAADQVCRNPTDVSALTVENYGHWAAGASGVIPNPDPPIYTLEGGRVSVENRSFEIDQGGTQPPLTMPANVANLGEFQYELPYVALDGKVYVGTTRSVLPSNLARESEVLEEHLAFTGDLAPSLFQRRAAVSTLDTDAYEYTAPRDPLTVRDIVRLNALDTSALELPSDYSHEDLIVALMQEYRDGEGIAASDLQTARYEEMIRSVYDPKNYSVIRFRESDNSNLTAAMRGAGFTEVSRLQLGTYASSIGEDSGCINFCARRWEAPKAGPPQVDGMEFVEIGELLQAVFDHPDEFDQPTQVQIYSLAMRLPSSDGSTTLWNEIQASR